MYVRTFTTFAYPEAGRALGRMYYSGLGVPTDYARAYRYYSSIEEAGIPAALYRLGCMLERGQGVASDPTGARDFYRRAAKRGHIFAKRRLGVLAVRRGNVLLGIPLLIASVVEGLCLVVRNQYDPRLELG